MGSLSGITRRPKKLAQCDQLIKSNLLEPNSVPKCFHYASSQWLWFIPAQHKGFWIFWYRILFFAKHDARSVWPHFFRPIKTSDLQLFKSVEFQTTFSKFWWKWRSIVKWASAQRWKGSSRGKTTNICPILQWVGCCFLASGSVFFLIKLLRVCHTESSLSFHVCFQSFLRRLTEIGTKEGYVEDVSADAKTAKTKDTLTVALASSNPLTSDV